MGLMDKANELKDQATQKAKEMAKDDDKVDQAKEKADDATGHKYSDHLDKAAGAAKEHNDKLGGQ